jgi:hypothetical protein
MADMNAASRVTKRRLVSRCADSLSQESVAEWRSDEALAWGAHCLKLRLPEQTSHDQRAQIPALQMRNLRAPHMFLDLGTAASLDGERRRPCR